LLPKQEPPALHQGANPKGAQVIDGKIVQMCFVVDDVDAAANHWFRTLGAGPFFVQTALTGIKVDYRGTPSFLDMDVAIGQSGTMQIELIKPRGTAPNVYTDMYPDGGTGFHHVAMFVEEFDRQVEAYVAAHHSVGCRGEFLGSAFAYMDTRSSCGFFTELYADTNFMRGLYAKVAAAAKDWDRSRPIRSLADVIGSPYGTV
jgi:hypothetical protein